MVDNKAVTRKLKYWLYYNFAWCYNEMISKGQYNICWRIDSIVGMNFFVRIYQLYFHLQNKVKLTYLQFTRCMWCCGIIPISMYLFTSFFKWDTRKDTWRSAFLILDLSSCSLAYCEEIVLWTILLVSPHCRLCLYSHKVYFTCKNLFKFSNKMHPILFTKNYCYQCVFRIYTNCCPICSIPWVYRKYNFHSFNTCTIVVAVWL